MQVNVMLSLPTATADVIDIESSNNNSNIEMNFSPP